MEMTTRSVEPSSFESAARTLFEQRRSVGSDEGVARATLQLAELFLPREEGHRLSAFFWQNAEWHTSADTEPRSDLPRLEVSASNEDLIKTRFEGRINHSHFVRRLPGEGLVSAYLHSISTDLSRGPIGYLVVLARSPASLSGPVRRTIRHLAYLLNSVDFLRKLDELGDGVASGLWEDHVGLVARNIGLYECLTDSSDAYVWKHGEDSIFKNWAASRWQGTAVANALHGMATKARRSVPRLLARLAWSVGPFSERVVGAFSIDLPEIPPRAWQR